MKSQCDFQLQGSRLQCAKCGFAMPSVAGKVHKVCGVQPKPGLGDMVAAGLSAIGITKERVSAVVGGDCGCDKRQEALNELGRKIGIG